FVATDLPSEQRRFDARETVHAGPIFGRKTFATLEHAAMREMQVLTDNHLSQASFQAFGKLVQGTRRHNVVYIDDFTFVDLNDDLQLTFSLPAGSYATVLLREFMKKVNDSEGDAATD